MSVARGVMRPSISMNKSAILQQDMSSRLFSGNAVEAVSPGRHPPFQLNDEIDQPVNVK